MKMEDDYDLTYDSTPTIYLHNPTDHIKALQLNKAWRFVYDLKLIQINTVRGHD